MMPRKPLIFLVKLKGFLFQLVSRQTTTSRHFRQIPKMVTVLFLIMLLPLRGWAGDAMSIHMSQQRITAGGQADEMVAMPLDCKMHAQAKTAPYSHPDRQADVGSDDGVMKNCSSCDLCIPLAALACEKHEFVKFASESKPSSGVREFVSAPLAPAEKPPIL